LAKILVVAKTFNQLNLILLVLNRLGHTLMPATTIKQATDDVSRDNYDLVIVEGNLQKTDIADGSDLAAKFQSSGMKVLIFSDRSENARPPIPFLPVPINKKELADMVNEILDNTKAQDD
jgi:DNA-binding response OmpR family regulator